MSGGIEAFAGLAGLEVSGVHRVRLSLGFHGSG